MTEPTRPNSPLSRLVIVILLSVFIGCILGPVVHWVLHDVIGSDNYSEKTLSRLTLRRIIGRLVLAGVVIGMIVSRRELGLTSAANLGLAPTRDRLKAFALALALTFVLLAGISVILIAVGVYRVASPPGLGGIVSRVLKSLAAGLAIGLLEEVFFRGLIFRRFRERRGIIVGVLASSIIYSLIHFAAVRRDVTVDGYEPFAGFRLLATLPGDYWDAISATWTAPAGYFVAGVCLALAYVKAGHLLLPMGMHAGWVFFFKMDQLFFTRTDGIASWWYGGGRLIDGLLWQIPVVLISAWFVWDVRNRGRAVRQEIRRGTAQE